MSRWHLEMHDEEPWRYSDFATDSWIGLICDEGDLVVRDFGFLIFRDGWAHARRIAEDACAQHNKGET